MRRAGVISLAIVLTLGLVVTASQAAKPKKAKAEAEIEGARFADGTEIFGDVHSKKSKCERKREVTLAYTGDVVEGFVAGTDQTDSTGDWEINFGNVKILLGPYVAEVERKKVGKGDKKLVCKAATSPETTVNSL